MNNEINAVIDNLCSKLGTTAEMLIPEVAKMSLITDVFLLIGAILAVVPIWLGWKKARNYDKANREEWHKTYASVIVGVIAAFDLVLIVGSIHDIVCWIVSPTGKAIMAMLNMINSNR